MSAPLYFLSGLQTQALAPGRQRLARSILAARGLSEAWADVEVWDQIACCEVIGKGPDGHPGLVVSALPTISQEPPRRIGYYADDPSIRWRPAGELVWIGIDQEFPPRPEDLARCEQFPGHLVKLADGRQWLVPLVRRGIRSGEPALPRSMQWDAAGRFAMVLEDRYQAIWDKTQRVVELFLEPGSPGFGSIEYQLAGDLALDFLGMNYRLGRIEQSAMKLVNSANWQQVLWAAIDGPQIDAAMRAEETSKKNGAPPPAAASSTPGAAACCPITDPAAATSGSCSRESRVESRGPEIPSSPEL
jgi:hypothetical protein